MNGKRQAQREDKADIQKKRSEISRDNKADKIFYDIKKKMV